MAELTLPGEDLWAFDHLAGYGAAAILASGSDVTPRLWWTDDVAPRLILSGAEWPELGRLVHEHAIAHTEPTSWVQVDGLIQGERSALFSPRVKGMDRAEIKTWNRGRREALDRIDGRWASLDRDLIGALGQPSYWAFDRGDPRPDHGASRWEMKTRNRGEEFVGNRLRLLSTAVASRSQVTVTSGLRGDTAVDEVGKNAAASRTPTGLMPPRTTDNARAWCALWGLSLLSVTHRTQGASRSAGHLGHHSAGHLFLPVPIRPTTLPRLRAILDSRALLHAATQDLSAREVNLPPVTDADRSRAWEWLDSRGVAAVVRFPVFRSANKSAPEKWAERGTRLFAEMDQ